MKKIGLTIVFLMSVFWGFAQNNLNDYKYAILPQKFAFFKEVDQFKLNTLARHLLKKNGFEVYYDTEAIPDGLEYNRCNAINVDVIKIKSLLKTRLKVQLKNCYNEVLFESFEGVSKNKDLEKAYKEALIIAFESFEGLNYRYQPKSEQISKVETVKEVKTAEVSLGEKKELKKAKNSKSDVAVLKAVPNDKGYILKDAKGNEVFQLIKSQKDDVFFLSNNQGILYKNTGNKWIREFMVDGKPSTEVLYIEF